MIEPRISAGVHESSVRPVIARANVLVVDDAPANLQLLFGMLKERGYRVRPVPSGRLALAAARAEAPDVVLLDVNMPEMDGYEVCRELKQDPHLQGIPVIFISALSEPFDKLKAFSAGGVDYVTKPFHLDEVGARVETHVALRRMGAQLEVQNAELAKANRRLVELEQTRAVFTSAIVHDLKSPLAAVLSSAQYLLGLDDVQDEPREVLEEMLASSHSLHRIVLNLLDVASIEETGLVPKRSVRALAEIVEGARATAQLTTRMTGHRLEMDVEAERDIHVDPDLVSRVIENLLDNAIKYAPRNTSIRVLARGDGTGGCSLRVEDRGRGIPEDQRERIFERHARLDRDFSSHARTSRGLGLAFCKLAVEAHGGTIWVEDNVPAGSAFCASIPGIPGGAA